MPPRSGRAIALAVAGHVNVDRFFRVPSLPSSDRTVPLDAMHTALGGPAGTIARSSAAQGVATGLISRIGDDFPSPFWRRLVEEGIDVSGVERVAGARSSSCYIFEDGKGHQTTVIDQGPLGNAARARLPTELLARTSTLHLTTGDPAFLLRLKAEAIRRGIRVAVDPSQEIHYRWDARRFHELVDGAEMLFGNQEEIERAMKLLGLPSVRSITERVPMVVATLGRAGSVAYTRAGTVRGAPRRVAHPNQITGAGDSFRGGFYAAWLRGVPLPQSLRAGNASATRWMQRGDLVAPRPRPRRRERA
ncbi:MAG: PfkB family carbohydrate kinase [Thermoplasmata archaeon]|nr:PfkB family carbohydrate kinase [Thermoplasmata archaeon]